jgi:hypothetical protein
MSGMATIAQAAVMINGDTDHGTIGRGTLRVTGSASP